jgi:S-DNA-T family DNA segregation ATPase FtsK/SpoIIIE
MLPSLVLGVYLGFSTGAWQLALMAVGSALIALFVSKRRSVSATEPQVAAVDRFRATSRNLYFDGKRVSRCSWLFSPKLRRAAHSAVEADTAGKLTRASASALFVDGFRATAPGALATLAGLQNGKPLEIDLAAAPHTFLVGPTGSGKSQLLRLMLGSLRNRYLPTEMALAVADFKGGDLTEGLGLEPWLSAKTSDLDDKSDDFWFDLSAELERRERLLAATKVSADAEPKLLVVVDELAEVLKSSLAARTLTSLAARGRSLGLHLLLANQGLLGVPRDLLLNLRVRIALASTDQVELVQLGGKAKELFSTEPGFVAARLIRHKAPDADFEFPVGIGAPETSLS